MSGLRVLFADDDPILYRLLELNFRVAGIAMDAVQEAPPDALLLDASMPGMDGHEVYRRLRERPELADLPVIFLTGRSAEEFSAYSGDRVRVVTKPFDPTELVELVREAIEARA
jgi:CheY-like chemotaxis protein